MCHSGEGRNPCVIPAKAGIHVPLGVMDPGFRRGAPAFAGVTGLVPPTALAGVPRLSPG